EIAEEIVQEAALPRGDPTRVMQPRSVIKRDDKTILLARVSEHTQDHQGNLDDQEKNLRRQARELGARVMGAIKHVGPGCDPSWLAKPAAKAKKVGAKLFTESGSRV